jgi:signal transduction histidine kinase
MNLLRIAQEAVANAVKHGGAHHVNIELLYAPASVCLNVIDDRCGFAADQSAPAGHFGLLDMRERAHSMGSELNVESELKRGTQISLRVSLNSTDSNHVELKTNSYSGG